MSEMTFVGDRRVDQRSWAVLPMRVEPDDRPIFGDDACAKNRTLAPRTVTLIEALGPPEAYSFSSLAAGATIAEHRHHRPLATASLSLSGGKLATIRVGNETRSYVDGGWLIFDYTQPHEVINGGSEPRIVLLVLVEPRR